MGTPEIERDPANPGIAYFDFETGTTTIAADFAALAADGWQVQPNAEPILKDGKPYLRHTLIAVNVLGQ